MDLYQPAAHDKPHGTSLPRSQLYLFKLKVIFTYTNQMVLFPNQEFDAADRASFIDDVFALARLEKQGKRIKDSTVLRKKI